MPALGCTIMNPRNVPREFPTFEQETPARLPGDLLAQVSIIVPIGPNDGSWRSLIGDLAKISHASEIWLVAIQPEPIDFDECRSHCANCANLHWITATAGRAHQMNLGAELSTRPFLWFLHADSRFGVDALMALERSLKTDRHALHFFGLSFQDDGPWFTRVNSLGVRIRSRILGLPFGDQGLCMTRDTFQQLGRYDESVKYGEDHRLVWSAHHHRVPLRCVGASIATSGRKYLVHGWLKTTLVHVWRTWWQAAPEFGKLLRSRCR